MGLISWGAIIILWLLLTPVAAIIAEKKGLSGWGFYFFSLLLSPIVGIVVALLATPNPEKIEARLLKNGKLKRCPYCAELVKTEAAVCKHCSRELEAPAVAQADG